MILDAVVDVLLGLVIPRLDAVLAGILGGVAAGLLKVLAVGLLMVFAVGLLSAVLGRGVVAAVDLPEKRTFPPTLTVGLPFMRSVMALGSTSHLMWHCLHHTSR